MENEAPVKKSRRYFFGWSLFNGIPFAMKWMEDNGHVVGGIPHYIDRMEITEEQFEPAVTLADLEKELPCPLNDEPLPLLPSQSTDTS